jgi:hypothetical protein
LRNVIKEIENNDDKDAANIAGNALGSPAKKDKISVVARAVRVTTTFIPAAKR